MFDKIVWLNKPRILSVFLKKIQDLIKILRCCNFLQIYTIFKVPTLHHKTQSIIWLEYLSISGFCHVLLWPVKDVTSYGKYVHGIKSYISCARYITILY